MTDPEFCSAQELACGFSYLPEEDAYRCLFCHAAFPCGEIFPDNGRFYTAEAAAKRHVKTAHGGALASLLSSDSRYLTLTDHQKTLLRLFAEGFSDAEIAEELKLSAATVRHQRFVFREKAKSAKMLLAVWELASAGLSEGRRSKKEQLIPIHGGAKMTDERYEITEAETEKILSSVFSSLDPLKLRIFSKKEKKKIVILRKIAEQFRPETDYTEKQVNAVLADIYDDYVTIRRYLIEYGFMDRTRDGSRYWLR